MVILGIYIIKLDHATVLRKQMVTAILLVVIIKIIVFLEKAAHEHIIYKSTYILN